MRDAGIAVTVKSSGCDEITVESDTGNEMKVWCLVIFRVKNDLNRVETLNALDQLAHFGDHKVAGIGITAFVEGDMLSSAAAGMLGDSKSASVDPGERAEVWLSFELPRGMHADSYEIHAAEGSPGFLLTSGQSAATKRSHSLPKSARAR